MKNEDFQHIKRKWPAPLSVAPLGGKYYGTVVVDALGAEVIKFWDHDDDAGPSEREKERFGNWTQARWDAYVSDSHWESETDYQAALEFCALAQSLTDDAVAGTLT